MVVSIDQVFDEWKALVQREGKDAYRVGPSSSSLSLSSSSSSLECDDNQDDGHQQPSNINNNNNRPFQSCPKELREMICDWCYRVIDHCDIDRGVVSICLSYFDRYLSLSMPHTSSIMNTQRESLIQLVAMSSLYLAVKLNSTRKISVTMMASLSQGNFREDQISKMELCIIKSLRWHLHPPTPFIYLTIASPLIEDDDRSSYSSTNNDHYQGANQGVHQDYNSNKNSNMNNNNTNTNIIELSRYLIELSVCDGFFVDKSPSSIAHAAITLAMETMPRRTPYSVAFHRLEHDPRVTDVCARRLRQVYDLACLQMEEEETEGGGERSGSSPTSVF